MNKSSTPRRSFLATLALLCVLLLPAAATSAPQAQETDGWPRQIDVPQGTVIIYQPQPESFEGNDLATRAAVSVTPTGRTEPVFGVVWMTARVETDRNDRTVSVVDLDVNRVRFPDATDEQEQALADLLEEEVPQWDLTISLDRLLAGLEIAEQDAVRAEDLRSDPPEVVFTTEPTVLVSIDGEPRMQAAGDSGLMRVLNTPFTIVLSSDPALYYLHTGGDAWYTAASLDGSWSLAQSVPAGVAALAAERPDDALEEEEDTEPGPPPAILVATEPTELIVTEGAPEYTPLGDTDLLYVNNSESDVLMEIASQRHFIVLSGRWFAAPSMEGPWAHVMPDELPATFSDIPADSEMGHLRISIPGTEEAVEAVMDHQIPQTAAIRRNEASLEVTYDGDPQFEDIEETTLQYAVNTATSVIKHSNTYYAVDNAVWFVSESAEGPWRVADSVPDEIYRMTPASPVYNVKYVYIYDTTPDVVYVGYYPGYMNSYVYGGTVVYGTGYYYNPWYGSYYYPRPATWGFHMRYNPWYGWSVGFSYSTGPFTFAIGWHAGYPGGLWGPMGYRGYGHGYHRGWHDGYRAGFGQGYGSGFRAGTRLANRNGNLYDRPGNRTRNIQRPAQGARRPSVATGLQNNVFSDRNGNVHRRTDQGWQSRSGTEWRSGLQSRTGGAAAQQQLRSNLDRSNQARQRGTTRTRSFQRRQASRPARRGGRIRQ